MAYTTIISAAELAANLHNSDWVIFDCRFSLADDTAGGKAYRQGHIPGARYADLNRQLSASVKSYTGRHPLPDFTALSRQLGDWGAGNRTQIAAYDDVGGAFAGRLWWLLRAMGHQDVAVLDGGINHWQKQKLPLTTVLPKIIPSHFRCYLDQQQWLSAAQVENALAANNITLIDARTPERFQGLQEPIDPVAGHVPKAVNRPFQLNLDNQGLFLPADQLNTQFQALINGRSPAQVAHMCGSGVTACHNLLAMEIAGLSGSKLYAGSWSEWIVNKNRHVATA
ncbi:sulfurtransferase [Methylomonas methanica]|uniref:3-mercaptopyruvate sulfurtransferase n=1 Tax=Methylomonas methanica (strain DSM 25384 / MC09) TaxID=857087 RepID=G0A5V1_METMM|nr:sulfurtransferase [Methylomonas methanica]AEF99228.1 3-mercaptopyruvate sulfurtransferase [Methylomonas methanica MC09]